MIAGSVIALTRGVESALTGASGWRVSSEVPVDPDSPEARQWLADELAKPEYQAAQPSWFDLLAAAIRDWFLSLNFDGAGGPPQLGILLVSVAIIVAIVILFLVFGVPRLNRRSRVTGALFGDNDDRNSAAIRKSAEQAASRRDFAIAIAEMFRAIARGLAERTVLSVSPGTTAHDFGSRAGRAFPEHDEALAAAASSFDSVRYLGGLGSEEDYAAIAQLESRLRVSKPELAAVSS
ncbi:MAG: DUF4129 domain-containing protein [Microbacteriaceae bacterium]